MSPIPKSGFSGDLAQDRESRLAKEKLFNDPKWATGASIRQLLIGRFVDKSGSAYYQFAADGTMGCNGSKEITPQDGTGKYQFRGDDVIDITHVDLFKQVHTRTFKVFVSQDELVLAPQFGFANKNNFIPADIYRRQKK